MHCFNYLNHTSHLCRQYCSLTLNFISLNRARIRDLIGWTPCYDWNSRGTQRPIICEYFLFYSLAFHINYIHAWSVWRYLDDTVLYLTGRWNERKHKAWNIPTLSRNHDTKINTPTKACTEWANGRIFFYAQRRFLCEFMWMVKKLFRVVFNSFFWEKLNFKVIVRVGS